MGVKFSISFEVDENDLGRTLVKIGDIAPHPKVTAIVAPNIPVNRTKTSQTQSGLIILRHMKEVKKAPIRDLIKLMEAEGYKRGTASSVCCKLVDEGVLRRSSRGLFTYAE